MDALKFSHSDPQENVQNLEGAKRHTERYLYLAPKRQCWMFANQRFETKFLILQATDGFTFFLSISECAQEEGEHEVLFDYSDLSNNKSLAC